MADIKVNGSRLTKVDLFPMFKKNIGRDYPESDGWKVYNRFNWVSYLHDFVLQRELEGKTERVVVEINTDKKITDDQLEQLGLVAERLASGGAEVIRKVLVISEEAKADVVPEDIEVYHLNDFLNEGMKHPVSHGHGPEKGDKSGQMVA